ncbi:MAG: DUF1080 domain-containing protein [Bacteroidota bacterium]|jgi:hypothetical protein|nr:DUF1080 domain-containing protein [Bacteroidota bacterium]
MLLRLLVILFILINGCTEKPQESKQEWIQLFNGEDLEDWHIKITGYDLDENFGNTFKVENGVIRVSYDQYDAFNERFGHMFFKDNFSSYLIGVEYRFIGEQAPGGPGWAFRNSGIMLHGQDPATMGKDQDFPISIEAQILGGNGTDERSTLNLCTPGTNVELEGVLITDHCINSSSKTYHGDQWVRAEVLVIEDRVIKHIMDGDTVLVYEKPQIGGGNVINHDPKVKKDGMLLKEGSISLQSESHPIEFRKVEIFDLSHYVNQPEELQNILRQLQNR